MYKPNYSQISDRKLFHPRKPSLQSDLFGGNQIIAASFLQHIFASLLRLINADPYDPNTVSRNPAQICQFGRCIKLYLSRNIRNPSDILVVLSSLLRQQLPFLHVHTANDEPEHQHQLANQRWKHDVGNLDGILRK